MRRSSSAALSACATNWEWFRSDWHKKAIAKDASAYRSSLVGKIRGLLERDPDAGRPFIRALDKEGVSIDVHLATTPTLSTVGHIIDPSGGNVSFRTRKDSEGLADKHLAPRYAAKAKSLSRDDWLIIEVMITARNALAHSSVRSVDDMNAAMQNAGQSGSRKVKSLARSGNRVTRSGIGAYLQAAAPSMKATRVMVICEHMLQLEAKFRN